MKHLAAVFLTLVTTLPAVAGERVPGSTWLRYADPAEAGFDPGRLEAARQTWEGLPSSAFLVVADGAVVAAWGEVDRRFMCHSVRKSFLSALYGIYWDRGEIELNKTLADLGIDDTPEPLLDSERQARILDLLKARSGVFHPAAYAGRTDSQPRGSQGPGRYFAYNNWDFNTLVTIFEEETGEGVFQAFDTHLARPLGMEDWRVSDGYYHYERDKSRHPAYPFRLSARDAARFGLLFAREGSWGDTRVLSRHWVRRSTALYSIDSDVFGYGFMWWVAREPRFERYGFATAMGVGNQMIAVLPDIDLVIVNRADTYDREGTPTGPLLDLMEAILDARTGTPAARPTLVVLEPGAPDPRLADVAPQELTELVGQWPSPPAPLGQPRQTTVNVVREAGHLVVSTPISGTFKHYLQPDGRLLEEDSLERHLAIRDDQGRFAGLADADAIVAAALAAVPEDPGQARAYLALLDDDDDAPVEAARVVLSLLEGRSDEAEKAARALADRTNPREVEAHINFAGYALLQAEHAAEARTVFELNTRLSPERANTWDSLGEAHMALGNDAEAIRSYERSLELDPENDNARQMIARIRGDAE